MPGCAVALPSNGDFQFVASNIAVDYLHQEELQQEEEVRMLQQYSNVTCNRLIFYNLLHLFNYMYIVIHSFLNTLIKLLLLLILTV